jgi:hypothetical protein
MKLIIFATLIASACAANPTFPTVWNSDYASKLILWQGGTYNSTDNTACCPKTSPQCKVQAEGQMGTQYIDGKNNRTAMQIGSQAIISDYKTMKQMLVQPSKSGTGWTCQSYCPLQDGYFNMLAFPSNAKDLGPQKMDGKTYEHYQWYDSLFKTIHMDRQDWYVDQSGKSPVPYLNVEALTPFGGAQIATVSSEFDNFQAGLGSFSFKVDNEGSCEESDKCQQNNNKNAFVEDFIGKNLPTHQHRRSLYQKAAEKVGKAVEMKFVYSKKESNVAADLTWPKDWSATETSSMLINQGGSPGPDGSVCCTESYSTQCQIQSQYGSGMKYFDYTNQRTRMEDPINGIIVAFYGKDGKNMLVEHNGTHDVCVKYCPIDPRDTLDGGKEYFLDDNATDLGKTTYKGQSAEHYQWKDTIFGKIVMQTTDFYAAVTGTTATPIAAETALTPFGGPKIGGSSVTWAGFKAGPQPAAKFDIKGVDTCPQDPQCGQSSLQLQRLASKQFHTYARYADL